MSEKGDEALIPVEHTNLGKPRLSEDKQKATPCFAYSDLLELKRIIESLRGVSSKL